MKINFKNKVISRHFLPHEKCITVLSDEQKQSRDEIQLKIDSGIYKYEEIVCTVCSNTEFLIIAERDRYDLPTKTSVCVNCGFVFSNPRLSEDSLNDFYKAHYRRLYMAKRHATEDDFNISKRKGEKIYNKIFSLIKSFDHEILTVVDIGCGNGGVLQYFSDQGHRCVGFEVDEDYGENLSANKNYPVISEKFDASAVAETADIIICNRVLEHIPNIRDLLEQINLAMNENSIFYTSVPSVVSFTKTSDRKKMDFLRYLHPAHIYHFSLISLKNLMSDCGFYYIAGDENGAIWKKTSESKPEIKSSYPDEFNNLFLSQKFSTIFLLRNNLLRVLVAVARRFFYLIKNK